ncbi:hypothetical protein B0H11DRAFT_2215698 [Mycena galericulata]|nr:hypothetical protein B0H11DRAFT_2215698 [Mycena galericulata]
MYSSFKSGRTVFFSSAIPVAAVSLGVPVRHTCTPTDGDIRLLPTCKRGRARRRCTRRVYNARPFLGKVVIEAQQQLTALEHATCQRRMLLALEQPRSARCLLKIRSSIVSGNSMEFGGAETNTLASASANDVAGDPYDKGAVKLRCLNGKSSTTDCQNVEDRKGETRTGRKTINPQSLAPGLVFDGVAVEGSSVESGGLKKGCNEQDIRAQNHRNTHL